ncbi:hypothetical protein [Accumulibacter sp.]|uniref:hypothetical protein n=1 Tax=Accumulibacter sp. TaxID=2053492 RepID=UPI0028C44262|nr:hypothetical protein [Accumulibacter sp.]
MIALDPLTTPQVVDVADIPDADRRAMYALYERYYDGSSWPLFAADLADKNRVLMLRDETGALQGFSTMAIYQRCFDGVPVRVLFSGDTVVDERHWGQQALAFTWLRLAGAMKTEQPEVPLYWLLISKGHRTYRYLPTFSRAFDPSPDGNAVGKLGALKDFLARDRFGGDYDATAGVVRFAQSRGHLRSAYAEVPEAHRRLSEVAYFLERNPGYARGDELVCLCELAAEQLQPIARRAFLAGMRAA